MNTCRHPHVSVVGTGRPPYMKLTPVCDDCGEILPWPALLEDIFMGQARDQAEILMGDDDLTPLNLEKAAEALYLEQMRDRNDALLCARFGTKL